MFCKNCGTEIDSNINFCSFCGQSLVEPTNSNASKTKGKGKAISSMVLGIIAIVWAFIVALALESIPSLIEKIILETTNVGPAIAGYFIGFNFLSLPTGITGLALGLSSKYKSGMRTSGIVTCSLSLLVALISLILMIINCI